MKPPSFFRRTDIVCLVCRHKDQAVVRPVEPPVASEAVTVGLGADRVLRMVVTGGTLILTQGFALPRLLAPAVSPMTHVHIPLRRLLAVQQALALLARTR